MMQGSSCGSSDGVIDAFGEGVFLRLGKCVGAVFAAVETVESVHFVALKFFDSIGSVDY